MTTDVEEQVAQAAEPVNPEPDVTDADLAEGTALLEELEAPQAVAETVTEPEGTETPTEEPKDEELEAALAAVRTEAEQKAEESARRRLADEAQEQQRRNTERARLDADKRVFQQVAPAIRQELEQAGVEPDLVNRVLNGVTTLQGVKVDVAQDMLWDLLLGTVKSQLPEEAQASFDTDRQKFGTDLDAINYLVEKKVAEAQKGRLTEAEANSKTALALLRQTRKFQNDPAYRDKILSQTKTAMSRDGGANDRLSDDEKLLAYDTPLEELDRILARRGQ